MKWTERNSLKEIARRSKIEGKTKVRIDGPFLEYPGIDKSLSEAQKQNNIVLAQALDSESLPHGDFGVRTWVKFKIIETLSGVNKQCNVCTNVPEIPEHFSPVNSDEFVLATSGGTVNVDGVQLTVENRSMTPFENGKKYVLVLSLAPSRFALLGAGPSGVFQVDDDDALQPINGQARLMQTEIQERFENVSKLKSHFKKR